jgi:hypothetical protein
MQSRPLAEIRDDNQSSTWIRCGFNPHSPDDALC